MQHEVCCIYEQCAVCAHLTNEFAVIPEAKLRDNWKWVGYTGHIHHTFECCI